MGYKVTYYLNSLFILMMSLLFTSLGISKLFCKLQIHQCATAGTNVPGLFLFTLINFFKDFIYLFDRQRSQVGREADREREEEAGSPLSRKPDGGLDPRTLGS